jgi:hypothetical protein
MIGINVCKKTNGKQQACKRLFCNGVAYCSTMQLEEEDPQKLGPYAVTTQDTAILTGTTQIISNHTHTFFSLKSLPQ